MAQEGKFREDLYFRLNVFPIEVPPLRERGADLEQLAGAFVQRFARRMGRRIGPLTEPQQKLLHTYNWPGNVRELQNVIERAVILSSGPDLLLERAMVGLFSPTRESAAPPPATPEAVRVLTIRELLEVERANLKRALEVCAWRVSGESGAARLLGIPPTTLSSRMKSLNIQRTPSSG